MNRNEVHNTRKTFNRFRLYIYPLEKNLTDLYSKPVKNMALHIYSHSCLFLHLTPHHPVTQRHPRIHHRCSEGADLFGCYFYLHQSALASSSGSGNRSAGDSEFAPGLRPELSLTFVPPDETHDAAMFVSAGGLNRGDESMDFPRRLKGTWTSMED